jgi:hypothetical protein
MKIGDEDLRDQQEGRQYGEVVIRLLDRGGEEVKEERFGGTYKKVGI